MTLWIAFLLLYALGFDPFLEQSNDFWWYVGTVILWVFHIAYHERSVVGKREDK